MHRLLRAYPKSVVTYSNYSIGNMHNRYGNQYYRPIVTYQHALLTFRIGF